MKIKILFKATRKDVVEKAKKERVFCERVNEMEAKEAFELGFTNGYMKALIDVQKIDIEAELCLEGGNE